MVWYLVAEAEKILFRHGAWRHFFCTLPAVFAESGTHTYNHDGRISCIFIYPPSFDGQVLVCIIIFS
jgi:hypothetical protein